MSTMQATALVTIVVGVLTVSLNVYRTAEVANRSGIGDSNNRRTIAVHSAEVKAGALTRVCRAASALARVWFRLFVADYGRSNMAKKTAKQQLAELQAENARLRAVNNDQVRRLSQLSLLELRIQELEAKLQAK